MRTLPYPTPVGTYNSDLLAVGCRHGKASGEAVRTQRTHTAASRRRGASGELVGVAAAEGVGALVVQEQALRGRRDECRLGRSA